MKKVFYFLAILWLPLILNWTVNWIDCSKYASQVSEIRSALQTAQNNADWYTQSAINWTETNWLSIGIAWNINAGNPYTAQVEKLKQLLALAEQDYENCLDYDNYLQDQFDMKIQELAIEYLESWNNYITLWSEALADWNLSKATENLKKSYTAFSVLMKHYNEERDVRKAIDRRYDIKPMVSEWYYMIWALFCSYWQKNLSITALSEAIKLKNKDAEELYDACNTLTEEDTDNLWCSAKYWDNFIGTRIDWELYCKCEEWYKLDKVNKMCILDTTYNSKRNNNSYSQEYKDAYTFAYANKITTMPTIEQANMNSPIIRAEIAKMLANWVKNSWAVPDYSKSCNFSDISSVKWDLYTAIIESCQLWIMGQWISNFRPYDTITKWEVSTAISRILWGSTYEWWTPYYVSHINALQAVWVLDNINNPNTNELRGNVMVALMRASNNVQSKNITDNEYDKSDYSAVNYNDNLIDIAKKCVSSEDKVRELYDNDNSATEDITLAINNTINVCKNSVEQINKLWDWEWDSTLRDWVLNVTAITTLYYMEFLKIVPYLDIDELDNVQEEKYNSILTKLEEIDAKLDEANNDLSSIQIKFAKKFWFELE